MIPIVLADAPIASPKDRVLYTKHWKQEHAELAPDKEHLGAIDQEWLRCYDDWGKDIGNILALISDVLSPHGIAELDALDWDQLREMLERV